MRSRHAGLWLACMPIGAYVACLITILVTRGPQAAAAFAVLGALVLFKAAAVAIRHRLNKGAAQ